MSPPPRRPASVSDCLAAARTDAERFHGLRPVQAWRPKRAWKPWVLGAAALAAGIVLVDWAWQAAIAPVAPPVAAADAPVAARLAVTTVSPPVPAPARPADEAALPGGVPLAPTGNADCDAAGCRVDPAHQSLQARAAMLTLVQDPDAWALSPEPLLAPAPATEGPHAGLMNVAPTPDEHDTTPGDADEPEAPAEVAPPP